MRQLFDTNEYFDYTKPTQLISNLVKSNFTENEIVLDFFAGSSTTAHSVLRLNAEDDGGRRFIMVQLPEPTTSDSKAFKDGYKTLSEIGKQRILKVIERIEEEYPEKKEKLDLGFKAFKLDSSNITPWRGVAENLDEDLFNSQNNIQEGRGVDDILYEVLLKYGLDLSSPIEEKKLRAKKYLALVMVQIICLDEEIKVEIAEHIALWKEDLNPEICRVLLRDSGMNDVSKTNIYQTLKRYGISEVRSI